MTGISGTPGNGTPGNDDELRARLRSADPAATLTPSDPDEVDRLVERAVTNDVRATGAHDRNPLTWLVAAAAVVLLAAVAGYALFGRDDAPAPTAGEEPTGAVSDPAPTSTELTASGGSARCMAPSPEVLAQQEVAFEATATGIADGVVTLEPVRFYAGDPTDQVTVTVPDHTALLEPGLEFEAGKDYLIAASGGEVIVCGFSGEATPELRTMYEEAFPQ